MDIKKGAKNVTLPINEDVAIEWDSTQAERNIREWAGAQEAPNAKYRSAFLWYDEESPENFTSYKFLIADVFDGEAKVVWRAVTSTMAILNGARGGTNIPRADQEAIYRTVQKYYEEFDMEAPELKSDKGFEMEVKQYGVIEKAAKLKEGEVEFVVSTNALDAHGERINVEGIDLKDFKKNPVVLWGHDGFNLPIAKATKVWKEGGRLMARAQFYLKDDFAKKVYDYIVDGFLNAVSIGGLVQEWSADGITINKMLMKEFSVVSVPANQEALVAAKSLTGDQKAELRALANRYARKMINKQDALVSEIETLETLVATLKEVTLSETHEDRLEETALNRRVVLSLAQGVDKQAEKIIKRIKLKGE